MSDSTTKKSNSKDPESDGFSPGSFVDRYEVQKLLGRGGMGEVYLAFDPTLRRKVALKRVSKNLGFDERNRIQILKEARRASKISDPRLAGVLDVLEHDGEVVLVMEFVDGVSIRERMTDPIPLSEFWDIAQECVKALEIAHREGLVHRDIKPENIMISRSGQVKILDFGIARRIARVEDTTTVMTDLEEGKISGTPSYMSPEAHRGQPLDGRADIFSLGVFFYEALAGRRPFLGETTSAVAGMILHEDPVPLHEANAGIPLPLSEVVGKMLVRDPDRRFQSASELLDALMAARRGEHMVATVQMPVSREIEPVPERPAVRRRFVWMLAAAVVVVVFVAVGGPQAVSDRLGITALPENLNVTVLPIEVEGEDEDRAAMGLGLTQVMTAGLGKLSIAPPLQIATFADVIKWDVKTPARAREYLGTPLALSMKLEESEQNFRVNVHLVETGSNRTIRRGKVEVPVTSQGDLLEQLYITSVGLLELADDAGAANVAEYRAGGSGTERFYLQGLGRLAMGETSEEVQRAIEDLELASRTNPDFAPALAALSTTYVKMHKVTGEESWATAAQDVAEDAVTLGPEMAMTHRALGYALRELGQVDEAIEAFREAVRLNPTDDACLYELGRSYGRRQEKEREAEQFQAAADARPHYWRPHYWRGWNFYKQGEYEKAIEPFQKFIERAPDYFRGYSVLGGIYLLRGEYEEAIKLLEKSNELHPTGAGFSNLATAYFSKRDFDRAIRTYDQALGSEFVDYVLWMNLGDAYFWGGDRDDASGAYEQALKLGKQELVDRPYDPTIIADLAMIHATLGEVDSARVYLERALADGGSDVMVLYSIALACWQLGDRDSAFSYLKQSVDGGFSVVSIRDWAVFDEWRDDERYRAVVGDLAEPAPGEGES